MAWEENSHICLHMQLIAILSRIGVRFSSKESEEYQQIGLGSFHMRNYPAPYRIVFVVNAPNSNTFWKTNPNESTNPAHGKAPFYSHPW